MSKEILPKLTAPSQNIGKIMEDVQLMLSLSQEEVANLLSLLEKSGDFGFIVPNHFLSLELQIMFSCS
jgi:hypothetical protein